jgi:hypothetical protein
MPFHPENQKPLEKAPMKTPPAKESYPVTHLPDTP